MRNVLIILPTSCAIFLLSALVGRDDEAHAARREGLFTRLATPVDVERELQGSVDPTANVFRFLSRATGRRGRAEPPLVLIGAGPGERSTVVFYSVLTLLRGGRAHARGRVRAVDERGRTRHESVVAAVLVTSVLASRRLAEAGVAARVGGQRRREDRAGRPRERAARAQLRLGRQDRAPLRRAERGPRVPGDGASPTRAASRPWPRPCPSCASAAARGGSPTRPPGPDPSQTAGRPIQIFAVHYMNVTETSHADWAWKPGKSGRAARHDGLEAGPARARERARGTRRLAPRASTPSATRRSGSRSTRRATCRPASTKAPSP